MLKQSNILIVNNIEYVVVSSVIKNNIEYLYLVNLNNNDMTMICSRIKNSLEIITDNNLLKELEIDFFKLINQ